MKQGARDIADIGLTEALRHEAACSIFAGGLCDCLTVGDDARSQRERTAAGAYSPEVRHPLSDPAASTGAAEVTAPEIHEMGPDGTVKLIHQGGKTYEVPLALPPGGLHVASIRVHFALLDRKCAEEIGRGRMDRRAALAFLFIYREIVRELNPALAEMLVAENCEDRLRVNLTTEGTENTEIKGPVAGASAVRIAP